MNGIAVTENTIHGHQVSRFLIRDLRATRDASQKLGIDFDNDRAAYEIAKSGIAKDFRKQKMQPKGELFNVAVAYVTGW